MAHFPTVWIFIQATVKSAFAIALVLYCLTYRLFRSTSLVYYATMD